MSERIVTQKAGLCQPTGSISSGSKTLAHVVGDLRGLLAAGCVSNYVVIYLVGRRAEKCA